jgi:single-strand DNA-binding protein
MASFNKVILMGNLTRDPQLKFLPSQMAVAEFGLACSRKFKSASGEDREDVLFIECSAFGKTGELINQYFTKGKPIFVEGRLKYDTWEDKNGGGKRNKISVVVENFQFIGGRDGATGGSGGGAGYDPGIQASAGGEYDQRPPARSAPAPRPPAQRPPAQRPAPTQQPPAEQPFGDEPQIDEADIPF